MTLEEVLSRLRGAKATGDGQYTALCPAHDDANPSLGVKQSPDGKILLHCYAGCKVEDICKALNMTPADLFPNRADEKPYTRPGMVLGDLARAKQIREGWLKAEGVETVYRRGRDKKGKLYRQSEVRITYFNEDGSRAARHRRRFHVEGDRKHAWSGTKEDGPIVPYGLHRLQEARDAGYIILVEGESDCWTLWGHGYPALGIPGASMVRSTLKASYLKDIDTVLVFQEPGEAGEKFAASVLKAVRGWKSITDEVSVIKLAEAKDPSDLYLADPTHFRENFEPVVRDAERNTLDASAFKGRPLTDMGNAERLLDHFGNDLCYCAALGGWTVWDGKRWAPDREELVYAKAWRVVRGIPQEAETLDDIDARDKVRRHATASESRFRLESMIKLAARLCSERISAFDASPDLFNVANGTIDLRTGELKPHDRRDRITKLAPVTYDPEAEAPEWQRFLTRITDGNEELAHYLRVAAGYSMTGHTNEECLFLLFGKGANGKTKFLEALRYAVGEHSAVAKTETFVSNRNDSSASYYVAKLRGARFVTAAEPGSEHSLKADVVKQLTGGDSVIARHPYSKPFEFLPICKVWIATNHKPRVRDTDEGIWRRIKLVPFNVFIPEKERDVWLLEKLQLELSGILSWCVEGAVEWHKNRLPDAEIVVTRTSEYRKEMDLVGQFIRDCCETGPNSSDSSANLYNCYRQWCDSEGLHAQSHRGFGIALSEREYEKHKGAGGRREWVGLCAVRWEPRIVSLNGVHGKGWDPNEVDFSQSKTS